MLMLCEIKKREKFFWSVLLGTLFLLIFYQRVSYGENIGKAQGTYPPGVLVSKVGRYPVFELGVKVLSIQDISPTGDAWISFSYQPEEGLSEEWIQAAQEGEKKGLHFLVRIGEENLQIKDFPERLADIFQDDYLDLNMDFWVSLIPDQGISPIEYDEFYHRVKEYFVQTEKENISLIWYPQGDFSESRGEQVVDKIDRVGINISQKGDLNKLDRIYQIFAGKKDIIINENIIDTYAYDLIRGMAFLEEFYYAVAIKYPAVSAVFQSSDLSQADTKYQKAIESFKQKNWVSTLALEKTNEPMFDVLNLEVVLTGPVEFLFLPRDDIQDIAYVEYKFNTGTIIQAIRSPFPIMIDTNQLHNGINSLTTVIYNKELKIIGKHRSYFQVKNNNLPYRAQRLTNLYSQEKKPIYARAYIPVLMYHDLAPQVPKELSSSTVSTGLFEKHLKALLEQGYTPVTFYELSQYLNKKGGMPAKPVIITMDDGYLSNYTLAFPLLKKYKVPATFFVTTAYMGIKTQMPHISWDQAREMEESGLVDIQSHTHWHRLYSELPADEVMYETSMSFGLIEKNLGKRDVKVLAYPEFRNTPDNRKWVQEQGVELQVTNLASKQSVTSKQNIQRIHVHNNMSPQALINTIKKLTM
ncbi:MAG TPA: polysaccharide deacetylase family protein [Clostridia bacterium]|nr:polysaccharide deacetylase family protein [Clostridia bacterium]